ncbi:MAG: hypothetical protein ACFCUU_13840 [Cyclobacteriaceae bacterium]
MKRFATIVFGFIGLVLVMAACEDCEDCHVLFIGPFVKVDFRADSMLRESRRHLAVADTLLSQTVRELNELLENEEDTLGFGSLIRTLTQERDTIRTEVRNFEGGRVFLKELRAEDGFFVPFYQDTLVNVFNLPLNMDADSSVFYFTFESLFLTVQDTLAVSYNRSIQSGFSRVNLIARNTQVLRHSFDSLALRGCQSENCNSNDVIIQTFF